MKTSWTFLGTLPGALSIPVLVAGCLGLETEILSERAAGPPEAPAAVEADPPGMAPRQQPGAAAAGEVRRIVERTLPYLEDHGVAWIDKHQCSSCHQVPVMMWSFHAAAERGVGVDRAKLDGWTSWVVAESTKVGSDNSDGIAHMILGRPGGPAGRDFEQLATFVADAQKSDGSWKAGGQLPTQRRPESETHRVASGWALLALASAGVGGEAVERGRERFEAWISEAGAGASLEWLVVRLLYAERFGPTSRADGLLDELLAAQRADGGWGWLRAESSDAFGTGLGLYALGRLGRGAGDPAAERARRFLAETQREDGSWAVRSTLEHEDGVTPTSAYWGTGWAAIGLLSLLDEDAAGAAEAGVSAGP